jgi:hypothetical protein
MASDASSDVAVQYFRSKPNQLNASGGNAPLLLRTSGHGVNGDDHDSDVNSVS